MRFLIGVFFFSTSLILLVVAGFFVIFLNTPSFNINILSTIEPTQSKEIRDRNDQLLFDFSRNTRRTVVPYEKLSKNIINATIAVEDRTFFEHNGIRVDAILRSFVSNLHTSSFSQGGSTITQQLIKNLLLSSEKKLFRKLREVIFSLQVERNYTKEEILASYLNTISYGGISYGIEAASLKYFGKPNINLSVAESAYLAALPKAPTFYSPYGKNRLELEGRKDFILKHMFLLNFIDKEEYIEAIKESVVFQTQDKTLINSPHFVFFVDKKLKNTYIAGKEKQIIKTTLDLSLQEKLEKILLKDFPALGKRLGSNNVSLVVLDTQTGEILSMIGSLDYFKEGEGNVNNTISQRQPGSSIKPFIYAGVFEAGLRPESIIYDVRTQFSALCDEDFFETTEKCYSPSNFSNDFVGPITLRSALAQSRNIPAVKSLFLSGRKSQGIIESVGLGLEGYKEHGLSLALGSNEVSLLDLVNAYRIFPNKGLYSEYKWKRDAEKTSIQVIKESSADLINETISDNTERSLVFTGLGSLLRNRPDVAVKTGTNNNTRDIWLVGYTKKYAVGIWSGNNDGTPLLEGYGASLSHLWNKSLLEVEKHYNYSKIDTFKRPSPFNPLKEIALAGGFVPSPVAQKSILSYITPTLKEFLTVGELSDQYKNWDYGVYAWENNIEPVTEDDLGSQGHQEQNVNDDIFNFD